MKLFKVLIPEDEPVFCNGRIHSKISAHILANDAEEARAELRHYLEILFDDPIEYEWIDFVTPKEVDLEDGPRVVGFARR